MNKVLFLVVALALVALSSATKPKKHHGKYVRPCFLHDSKCIRDNLSANSKCSRKVLGSIPRQYTIRKFEYETPYFNSSYIDHDLVIQNHDQCKVSEFFFNTESDSMVLAIDCRNMIFSSNRTLIQHYSLREDAEYHFSSTYQYPLLRMTAHVRRANHMDICKARVFTDVAAMPKFIVSPNDPPTKNFLSRDLSFLPIYERETFFYRGPVLFRSYVNSIICNFGCY